MAKDIFLFDGGPYKRGMDDGRVRKPLTCIESQMLFDDPDHPGEFFNNVYTSELAMNGYPELDGLAVDDRIYVMLVPDATGVRGLWMMPQDAVAGLTFDVDLVDICEVSAAMCADPLVPDAAAGAATYGDTLELDAGCGLGESLKDAHALMCLHGGVLSDYRDIDALQALYFDTPGILNLGQGAYVRMTVTAVPPAGTLEDDCSSCGGPSGLPFMQMGVIADRLAVNKSKMKSYCTCRARICAGCCHSCGGVGCDNCPTTEEKK